MYSIYSASSFIFKLWLRWSRSWHAIQGYYTMLACCAIFRTVLCHIFCARHVSDTLASTAITNSARCITFADLSMAMPCGSLLHLSPRPCAEHQFMFSRRVLSFASLFPVDAFIKWRLYGQSYQRPECLIKPPQLTTEGIEIDRVQLLVV